jgi:hypothetical protein
VRKVTSDTPPVLVFGWGGDLRRHQATISKRGP